MKDETQYVRDMWSPSQERQDLSMSQMWQSILFRLHDRLNNDLPRLRKQSVTEIQKTLICIQAIRRLEGLPQNRV
jgi:iron-sulfur cluster repair protein YtfE (RIC family)